MRRTSDCEGDTTLGIGVEINGREIYATVNNYTRVTDPSAYEGITPIGSGDVSQEFIVISHCRHWYCMTCYATIKLLFHFCLSGDGIRGMHNT